MKRFPLLIIVLLLALLALPAFSREFPDYSIRKFDLGMDFGWQHMLTSSAANRQDLKYSHSYKDGAGVGMFFRWYMRPNIGLGFDMTALPGLAKHGNDINPADFGLSGEMKILQQTDRENRYLGAVNWSIGPCFRLPLDRLTLSFYAGFGVFCYGATRFEALVKEMGSNEVRYVREGFGKKAGFSIMPKASIDYRITPRLSIGVSASYLPAPELQLESELCDAYTDEVLTSRSTHYFAKGFFRLAASVSFSFGSYNP